MKQSQAARKNQKCSLLSKGQQTLHKGGWAASVIRASNIEVLLDVSESTLANIFPNTLN